METTPTPLIAPAEPAGDRLPDDPLRYRMVLRAVVDGRLIPFLGAGVNLCGRPTGAPWHIGQYLPSGKELATHLVDKFGVESPANSDLARVAQYVDLTTGSGPLYEELHRLLDADYRPTPLHDFLANLPSLLRERGYRSPYQLVVTTNYDDVLEQAFEKATEPYDLVSYVANGKNQGKFLHRTPDGQIQLIDRPNEYLGLSLDRRCVILKIHGAVDRIDPDRDSYVITEDHYIDYLTRTDITNLVPVTLAAKLRRSNFLFLGYSLQDWNLRVILHRIWSERSLSYKSWSVQLNPQTLDQKLWQAQGVEILGVRLEDYVAGLSEIMKALPHIGSVP